MLSFRSRLLATVLLIGGGVFSPAPLFSDGYRFFASFYDESRATVYSMNTSGTLQEGQSYLVGNDAERVAASPNGQLVIVSSSKQPQLSAFFINRDDTVDPPKGYDPLDSNGYDPPVEFHPSLPLAFADFYRSYVTLRIDYSSKTLTMAPCAVYEPNADTLVVAYSKYTNQLYHRSFWPPQGITRVGVKDDGCLTTTTYNLPLAGGQMSSDFTVSPDGRWAVAIGLVNPMMSIIKIHRDGSLEMHQQFSFTTQQMYQTEHVRFTHDGRYLILLSDVPDDLTSYRYDPKTDLWVEVTHAQFPGGAFDFSITPDDRYLVWIQNYPGFGKDGYYYTTLQTIQINDDGSFTYLPGKSLVVKGYMATLEFIPPWSESYPDAPNGVMAY